MKIQKGFTLVEILVVIILMLKKIIKNLKNIS